MKNGVYQVLKDFFNRIPHLKPLKDGILILKIDNEYYQLEYKNSNIIINLIKPIESKDHCIVVMSKKSFYTIFSSENVENFYNNLLEVVLVNKDVRIQINEEIDPMKNVFFKIISINRGKRGINRYELMIPII